MKKQALGVFLSVLFLAACGADEPTTAAPVVIEDERPEEPAPEPLEYAMVLEAVDELPLTGSAMMTIPVTVSLRDALTGAPAPEEMIGFEVGRSPSSETSLSASTAVTNAEGLTSVSLRLGSYSGTAVVEVTHPEAAPLRMEVHISEPRFGAISVDVINPSPLPIDISPYRVSFIEGEVMTCAEFVPRRRLPEPVAIANAGDVNQPIVQEGFAQGEYTVIAEALGSAGAALATGCADGVVVTAGDTTRTRVPLEMLPISPSGVYEVNGVWDISEAVASANSTSGTLVNVIEFMANPGAGLYDLVITEIEDAVDFPIAIILGITGIRQQIVDFINAQLFQFEGVETFVAVAGDLSDMLNELDVQSILTIRKTDDDYNFVGHEEWSQLTVHWTWQCQNNPAPDCGEYIVDLQGDGAAAAAVSYEWTGHVDGYDQLVIDSHEAHFDIGRLQLYLLEQVMLPQLTGGNADSLDEALAYWVDCDGLAQQALAGNDFCDPTGTLCLGETLIEAACTTALAEVADWITQPLLNQPVLVDIALSGHGRLRDVSANSFADQIREGYTTGTVVGSTEPVTVSWTADRIEAPASQ